ncbi:OPT family oligopeptide transporter [Sphingorhabdus contaminans]|uniref:Oligopeptide transporter, OPT family n=1 Tax=Sphingorhabdus contaminans TaxID=1343899 RepID=A0A553WKM7_9SPHN|nr:oligopeptide transporter, OPT family [Sphingorhabdus contaminans]TSB05265.1 oligopeptide transporter, OPT family [Sphingorhabdus contaminans]
MRELTIRSVILGGLITLLFTAANVYLGLKAGLTFATSIPAAVISMAILRLLPGGTILENNIVQTIASAAGTLSAIIFVLPGLVILGYWQGFPFLTTAAVCATGGILGVMFSVPLRRALVTGSDLPYPEGKAAAEVLIVGSAEGSGSAENKRGLATILVNALLSACVSLLISMKLVAGEIARYFKIGAGATGASTSLSLALVGVGHLVGLSVGLAMLLGMAISWLGLVPYFSQGVAGADAAEIAGSVFREKARFIGAGTIGVAAIWTLLKIIGPIVQGLKGAMAASAARSAGDSLALTERDIPIKLVGAIIVATLIPIAFLLWQFLGATPLAGMAAPMIGLTILYILLAGVVIASVCGYMAGLIGASNSPISGVGILAVVGASLMLLGFFGRGGTPDETSAMIAYALFATAIVFGIATISNDNLQDLKTGQIVGATPWRQQIALVIGVLFGSLAIPPVLDLLNNAFGFAGSVGAGENALAAPQALLISALAKGVLGGDLDWPLLGLGALIGVAVIVLDELLGKAGKRRLPPLGVGMGVYLPMALTFLIVVGTVLGHYYDKWAEARRDPEAAKRMGVLAATGLIVGESLFGVAFAGIVAGSGSDAPLAVVGEGFAPIAEYGGAILFVGILWWIYNRTRREAA